MLFQGKMELAIFAAGAWLRFRFSLFFRWEQTVFKKEVVASKNRPVIMETLMSGLSHSRFQMTLATRTEVANRINMPTEGNNMRSDRGAGIRNPAIFKM
jgi:hypothetical protein